ncbi:DUF6384 family protein [Pseudomonas sp. MWU13-2105]|uniref:DUF6384 family protein n=1 Tax=Pseudomonas sp. MWU13-2105 TaxID=2935074 RepID=UPI00200E940C|nr:DUF6384 family protein [Pseudomonas sp. MWU13-2105]
MSNLVSLSEQMGAMALIDELRFSQAELQKQLDLPKHRLRVAEQIREFYRAKGIEVEDALVEEGVRNFFANRLTYQAPVRIGRLARLLARAYITRRRWLMPTVGILGVGLWLVLVAPSVSGFFARSMVAGAQAQVDGARELLAGHVAQREQLEKRVSALYTDALVANMPTTRRLLEEAGPLLEKARTVEQVRLPLQVTEQSRTEDSKLINSATDSLKKDSIGLNALATQLDALSAQATTIRPWFTQLQDSRDKVRKMGLSKADAEQFQPLFAKAEQAVKDMNATAAEQGLQEVEQLRAVAAAPLTLEVVSRAGEKSMVERNFDPTGGKSWYLLAEALDASGNVVPLPITSVETGERRYASMFGVRVNQATYQAAKNDKLADGLVDDRLIGKKAANSLSFAFGKGPVKTKPDYILEW